MKLRDLFSDDATIGPRAAAIEVKGLVRPEFMIEIEVVAMV